MIAPAAAPAKASTSPEVHHEILRCLLRLCERADEAGLTGEGIELALRFEYEARRWGVDPDVSRDELAAMIEGSTAEISAVEHRDGHTEDFRRWGRQGVLRTLALYGASWFSLLALRRWEKVGAEAPAKHLATASLAGRS